MTRLLDSGAYSYHLVASILDGSDTISIETQSIDNVVLGGLTPGAFYHFFVLAKSVSGSLNEIPSKKIRRQTGSYKLLVADLLLLLVLLLLITLP